MCWSLRWRTMSLVLLHLHLHLGQAHMVPDQIRLQPLTEATGMRWRSQRRWRTMSQLPRETRDCLRHFVAHHLHLLPPLHHRRRRPRTTTVETRIQGQQLACGPNRTMRLVLDT
jgi:hypothetical protein